LSIFALSLISVRERRSYPVMVEQIVKTEEQKAAGTAAENAG
jgi:hypothetical protein